MTKWQPAGEESMQAVKNQNVATTNVRLDVEKLSAIVQSGKAILVPKKVK
jgi:hypothetical protein